jgi:large conductance mechanosensitive channel
MPALGKVTGGVNFTEQYLNLNFPDTKIPYAEALRTGEPVIGYGQFLTDMISFVILAFAVFIIVKKALGAIKKEEQKPVEEAKVSNEEKLLTEIRDLLKSKA